MQINQEQKQVLLIALFVYKWLSTCHPVAGDKPEVVQELIEKVSNESTPGTGRIGSPAEVDGDERMGDSKDTRG